MATNPEDPETNSKSARAHHRLPPIPTKPQKDQQTHQLKPGCGCYLCPKSVPVGTRAGAQPSYYSSQWVPKNKMEASFNSGIQFYYEQSALSATTHPVLSTLWTPTSCKTQSTLHSFIFPVVPAHLQVVTPQTALTEALTHTVKGQRGGPLASFRCEDPSKTPR